MKKLLPLTLAVALSFGAVPVLASSHSGVQLTDQIRAQITQTLTAQGYQVGKIKVDDGLYEAYARKDGKRLEIYLDAGMNIVRTKMDD